MKQSEDDIWLEKYQPLKNHLDGNAGWSGTAFETYGEELDYIYKVAQKNPKMIWTLVDTDNGLYIISGFKFVDRMNYFVTELECKEEFESYKVEEVD